MSTGVATLDKELMTFRQIVKDLTEMSDDKEYMDLLSGIQIMQEKELDNFYHMRIYLKGDKKDILLATNT